MKTEKFLRLVNENPDLPIIPMLIAQSLLITITIRGLDRSVIAALTHTSV